MWRWLGGGGRLVGFGGLITATYFTAILTTALTTTLTTTTCFTTLTATLTTII